MTTGILEILVIPFIGAALQVLLTKLDSCEFLQFFKKRGSEHKQWTELKFLLLTITAVLTDAEEKEITNPSVNLWVEELKDAVYEAEDVLDEIFSSRNQKKVSSSDVKKKVEDVVARLKYVADQKDVLGLKGTKEKTSKKLPTTSLMSEPQVFGRENDERETLEFLLSNPAGNENNVLAIVGMPGVGKTTLAQLLFNNKMVEKTFEIKAWVHVSEDFDVFRMTKIIYESVTFCSWSTADLNMLQVRLQEALRGKKLLLVLDDIWNENFDDWDVLKRPFQDVSSGSRTILTSRRSNIASTMRAARIYHLNCLSGDDCWSLFTRHAFRPGIESENPEIKERVAKMCGGLPLAAKTLGALLFSKQEIDEWDGVLNSRTWDFPRDKFSILPVLRLSYYHLPSHLKHCFAYCSIFPKGYQIEKANLVRLWIAQGLVMQQKSKRREEVGNEYFSELLSRSFFQQIGSNEKPYFIMHDLFNDLARDVAGEFCFNFGGESENETPEEARERVRYFSYLADKYDVPDKFNAFKCANNLRTFMPLKLISSGQVRVLSASALKSLLNASSRLRVLSLSPYQISKIDDSIGNLKYLRYLDLSHSLIKVLPESVCSLYNLETLLLQECRQLTKLPKGMKNLVKLQHLNIKRTKLYKMPLEFGKLKNLHVLTDFFVGKSGSSISELKQLSNLGGALSILNLENVGAQAADSDLKEKMYLSELVFQWSTGIDHNPVNEEMVLDGLQPHKNLKKLTIINYRGRMFNKWLGDSTFSKMVYLRLDGCENCSSFPSLWHLSSLKELHVVKMKSATCVEFGFFPCNSLIKPFKSLQILKFEDMPNWSVWSPFTYELPCLETLHLHKCPKLTGNIPKNLPSLKSVRITECSLLKLEFLHENTEHRYEALKSLDIKHSSDCRISFPLGYFPDLERLQIQNCSRVKICETSNRVLRFLHEMEIQNCQNVELFPQKSFPAPNLARLSISMCSNLKAMPELLNLSSLEKLKISECKDLESFPRGGLPGNLVSLSINDCSSLASMPEDMHKLSSLLKLKISKCPGLKSFPEGGLPVNIKSLSITGCNSQLDC